ncbi:sarcosine oxidase [Penicillium canariense]|uniref:Sarcosine oxidase n=1 Tax=Penicillium canariense TaxID=189055 RepID=A0A9W9HZ12_9EURO|nr:sarcosine oxidase [Penicillium canariense]KAJ5160408.1 sarcosine oxidase [Penicillium canariense]
MTDGLFLGFLISQSFGLGVHGSAAAYQAALKGAKVLGLEQFEFGRVRGASHDTSRIVRKSNSEPEYVALVKSAYKDWAELEELTGQKLLTTTVGLFSLPKDAPIPSSNYTRSLAANDVPHEILSSKEVMQRWPQFDIPDTVQTVYDPATGIVHANKTVAAMQYLARFKGAVLKDQTLVERIIPKAGGEVLIATPKGTFHVRKLILTTDAWTNRLLEPLGTQIPLRVMQEQITYFKPTEPAELENPRFPVWIWGGPQSYYGFPCYGEPTIKAGHDCANNFMSPEERTYVHSPRLQRELSECLQKFMPDCGRQPLRTITCQYTIPPDRRFIISPLEQNKDIIVGLGAAHAFKFAPVFGRVLAELAIDGKTDEDISKFGIPKNVSAAPKI